MYTSNQLFMTQIPSEWSKWTIELENRSVIDIPKINTTNNVNDISNRENII